MSKLTNIPAKIFVGFDPKEAVVYHACCQSIIDRTTVPVALTPLTLKSLGGLVGTHSDGSNEFVYSRFLVPYLCDFNGWAAFIDGDMVFKSDAAELFENIDDKYAAMVVKHDYKTKFKKKYLGNINEDYPKKNWSSVILWNCGHPSNKVLTPECVKGAGGKFLHRFEWLDDGEIGALDVEWNWLAMEFEKIAAVKLVHYTIGCPCFRDYRYTDYHEEWYEAHRRSLAGME